MTSEALAVVQAFIDLTAAGDFRGVADLLDPDVVFFGTRGGLDEERVFRGPDVCVAYMREVQDPWRRFDVVVERLVLGDTVVAFLRETAQARHADLDVHNETAVLFRVAEQKIVEATGYLDRREALAAARRTE
jgi:ketosteroid isomerase-like protein